MQSKQKQLLPNIQLLFMLLYMDIVHIKALAKEIRDIYLGVTVLTLIGAENIHRLAELTCIKFKRSQSMWQPLKYIYTYCVFIDRQLI